MTGSDPGDSRPGDGGNWPALPFDAWSDTCATLHLWTQIIGKIRLAKAPMMNHWWQVPQYVTCRGLTTSPIPHDTRLDFQIDFDFIDHCLCIEVSDGRSEKLPLEPCAVAEFYHRVMDRLTALGLGVPIWTVPVELPDPIPFEQDRSHAAYDPRYARQFWRVLVNVDRVLKQFRSRFIGKASPVHFFWGSFDMAVTRFSGRRAPPHPGGTPNVADRVTREAYSHEVSSCGFWPGNGGFGQPAFYSYAYPEPAGLAAAHIRPEAAYYSHDLHEFILPYDAVRQTASPDQLVLEFLESTYAAAADLGHWNRVALER
ncbi:MAG: hypothetical protein JOY83_08435 [Alphaproteobacteria bacterium]|nr:hypothetical protein [Alphaproteobacteria bacterium]